MKVTWAALGFFAAFGVLTGFSIGMPILALVAAFTAVLAYRGRFGDAPAGIATGLGIGIVLTGVLALEAVALVALGALLVLLTGALAGIAVRGVRHSLG